MSAEVEARTEVEEEAAEQISAIHQMKLRREALISLRFTASSVKSSVISSLSAD